jgi:hypothetical protein
MFDKPFDPAGTKWTTFNFDGNRKADYTGAVWEFKAGTKLINDRTAWTGAWENVALNNDRIKATILIGKETHILELIFIDEKHFIAAENNHYTAIGERQN